MARLNVKIGELSLKNPVMTASGTFGYGLEFADFMPLDGIGGIIVKGTTLKPREGNDYPRMAETASGMLNCVGLQNKGVDYFCEHIYPQIKDIDTNMIVKLSPNVTDITEIARSVEAEGADSVSLINTLMGMAIDIEKRKRVLSIGTGGLSGPAVKPVALRMVYQVAKAVKIPVIGLGGICSAKDAIEFLMAGATAIEIGTANFLDPAVSIKVRDGINDWLDGHGCQSVEEIIGVIS